MANATASRASARQIRKAFGPDALATIDAQGETLQSVVIPRLMTIGQEFGRYATRVDEIGVDVEEVAAMVDRHLRGLTFWQRVRWLVMGA